MSLKPLQFVRTSLKHANTIYLAVLYNEDMEILQEGSAAQVVAPVIDNYNLIIAI